MNSIGYGLNLSGYSGGNTRLSVARQTSDEQIELTILRNSIFLSQNKGWRGYSPPDRKTNRSIIAKFEIRRY